MRTQALFVVIGILALASDLQARTWRVEKDGTGDFSVLYEAVDAAAAWPGADGDTIRIGPGRFQEYRREHDYAWETYCCVHVRDKDLTLIGSGPENTVIGLEHFDPHYPDFVIGVSASDHNLVIEDLAISGVFHGVAFWSGDHLRLRNCKIVECDLGVVTEGLESTAIQSCRFVDNVHAGVIGTNPNGVSILSCEFVGCVWAAIKGVGGIGWTVRDTEVHDCTGGIQFEQQATGTIERCRVSLSGGNPPAIGLLTGSIFSLYDNFFQGRDWAACFATGGTTVTARNNIFIGGEWACLEINRTPMDFQQNHIINGGEYSVRALWARGSLSEPVVVDLAGNYWGTTDPAQIAAWVDDYTPTLHKIPVMRPDVGPREHVRNLF